MRLNFIYLPLLAAGVTCLQSCDGIFDGIYDEPSAEEIRTVSGQLYVDASSWTDWHFIDLKAVGDSVRSDSLYNPSDAWRTIAIPQEASGTRRSEKSGIYTYWYDVYGAGVSVSEFRAFQETDDQPLPNSWTFAVHRNNVMTNGGEVAATEFHSIERLPALDEIVETLQFQPDIWNENAVWTIQDRMLLGLVGNQGIEVNETLSQWLHLEIPPMPPAFTHDDRVFILRLQDGTYAALQLADYMSKSGVKCCLTINYKYPL